MMMRPHLPVSLAITYTSAVFGAGVGTGAATWRLEISTSETMSPLVYSTFSPLAPAAASFTLPNASPLSANTLYYWRVYRTTDDTTSIKGQPFIVVESLPNSTLYCRVRAKDAAGNLSAEGPGRRLVIAAP